MPRHATSGGHVDQLAADGRGGGLGESRAVKGSAIYEGHKSWSGQGPARVLGLLFDAVHRGGPAEKGALERRDRLTELKMRLLNDRASRRTAWRIAREQGWASNSDAEYVAITKLQADALVTTDSPLMAEAQGLVPLALVSALTTAPAAG